MAIGVTVNGERDILGLWAGDGGEEGDGLLDGQADGEVPAVLRQLLLTRLSFLQLVEVWSRTSLGSEGRTR